MSQINDQTVDVDDVIRRIQAIARGELPQDAVSVDELRNAIAAQRRAFSQPTKLADGTDAPPVARKTVKKTGLILPNLDLGI